MSRFGRQARMASVSVRNWRALSKLRVNRMAPPMDGWASNSRSSPSSSKPATSTMSGPGGKPPRPDDRLFMDVHFRADRDTVEQIEQVVVVHANAADGTGHAHGGGVRRAVNVDIA